MSYFRDCFCKHMHTHTYGFEDISSGILFRNSVLPYRNKHGSLTFMNLIDMPLTSEMFYFSLAISQKMEVKGYKENDKGNGIF